MSEWQPIETAPRDGQEVLLHYAEWYKLVDLVVSGHWRTSGLTNDPEATWEHSLGYGDADHWMPLPKPPTTERES